MQTQYLVTTVIVIILFSISGFILLQERYKPESTAETRVFEFYIDNTEKKPTTKPSKPIEQPVERSIIQKSSKSAEQPIEHIIIQKPSTNVKQPFSQINIREIELSIHNMVNQVRQEHGLHPLIWNEELANVAREHSQDMATRGYYSHISPEGVTPQERGKKHGFEVCGQVDDNNFKYKAKYMFQKNRFVYDGIAENAEFIPSFDLNTINIDTVTDWMNSEGHRKNILHPHITNEGIGVAIKNDKAYITQNLC